MKATLELDCGSRVYFDTKLNIAVWIAPNGDVLRFTIEGLLRELTTFILLKKEQIQADKSAVASEIRGEIQKPQT